MKKASNYAYLQRKAAPKMDLFEPAPETAQDLNVIVVTFDNAKAAEKNVGAGDPFFCKSCRACLNNHSVILSKDQYEDKYLHAKEEVLEKKQKKEETAVLEVKKNQSVWVCEFCDHKNLIQIEKEEIPKVSDMVYLLESNAQKMELESATQNASTVIFCIDNSGSMNSTTEVKGKVNLKHGISEQELELLRQFMEPGDEQQLNFIPGQNNTVTYVSRKQCVLAAIESQISQILKEEPDKRVGLVSFNNQVLVLGDCSKDPVHIVGDKLGKKEQIILDTQPMKIEQPVKNVGDKILQSFDKLEATGATALGPAILSAIELASLGKTGSSVVVCTDGLANIGLGNIDNPDAKEFYLDMALRARDKNVTVNLVTIKGEGCKLDILSKLAQETNGRISIVDPVDLDKKFAKILKDEVVGVKVTIKIRLHKALCFRNEEPENLTENGSVLEKVLANATVKTKISFEYELKTDEQLQALGLDPEQVIEQIKAVPFQALVTYESTEGHKFLRVITDKNTATKNRAVAIEKVVEIAAVHERVAQRSAAMAKKGDYRGEKAYNSGWINFMNSKEVGMKEEERMKNKRFEAKNAELQMVVHSMQNKHSKPTKPEIKPVQTKEEIMEEDEGAACLFDFEQARDFEEE